MEIDAAKRLLKERKFDPKEIGYGEVEDDEDKAFRKLFAEVGTRAEVLVGILGSMEMGCLYIVVDYNSIQDYLTISRIDRFEDDNARFFSCV